MEPKYTPDYIEGYTEIDWYNPDSFVEIEEEESTFTEESENIPEETVEEE